MASAELPGERWAALWVPEVIDGRATTATRVVPVTSGKELLALLVVERRQHDPPLTASDERDLRELARQLSLALRNAQLDTELRHTLVQLQVQADELRKSRARIVAAADNERRRIERDLHDGAQQLLVALAINISLARDLVESSPHDAIVTLDQLYGDTNDALRGLAISPTASIHLYS